MGGIGCFAKRADLGDGGRVGVGDYSAGFVLAQEGDGRVERCG